MTQWLFLLSEILVRESANKDVLTTNYWKLFSVIFIFLPNIRWLNFLNQLLAKDIYMNNKSQKMNFVLHCNNKEAFTVTYFFVLNYQRKYNIVSQTQVWKVIKKKKKTKEKRKKVRKQKEEKKDGRKEGEKRIWRKLSHAALKYTAHSRILAATCCQERLPVKSTWDEIN